MITTIHSPRRDRACAGFTLVEMMISATLGGLILVAVLSSFLFLGRSGWAIQSYNDMERQARSALEVFAEDTRQASAVTWHSATSVTLVVNSTQVTYTYSGDALTRTSSGNTRMLVDGITAFSFLAYTINGTQISDFSSAAARIIANNTTKQIQISLAAARSRQTVKDATNTVLSARFILRNKRVTA
ncbi:MAG TPA: prepilin-type N-terminal cleavage/methylation domain-containing protein [Opitutus sp.]|nr:prepilin-type N-terminal cleavage/methylation domain-containing protein [Opitutus sp.]